MIKLLNGYGLKVADEKNWAVTKTVQRKSKNGDIYNDDQYVAFFPTVGQAMYHFIQVYLKEEDAESFAEILERLDTLQELSESLQTAFNEEKDT